MVMFSNLHIDYNYTEGASNKCGELTCCHGKQAEKDEDKAGPWGDFNCDLPEKTMVDMFAYIDKHIKPDVAFWGGGTAPSNINSVTEDQIISTMKKAVNSVGNISYNAKTYVNFGSYDTTPFG